MESVLSILGIKKIKAYKKDDIFLVAALILTAVFNPVMILKTALEGKALGNGIFSAGFLYVIILILRTVFEELLFRGFLYGIFAKKRIFAPVIISSALFAAAHFLNLLNGQSVNETAFQAVNAFAVGMIFALSRAQFGRIFECICVHLIVNLTSLYLPVSDRSISIITLIFSAVLVIYALVLMVWMDKAKKISYN